MLINFGGGLTGTGVPLDLKNINTDHSQSQIPAISSGAAQIRFTGFGGHAFIFSILSVRMAKMMVESTALKKNNPHKKVKRPWCFSRLVALW
ncbi:MAG: hypothetical protein ABRQ28_00265 [Smithellaceae bacterium]